MTDILTRYKTLDYDLPKENLAWRMHEAGVDNFGKDGVDVLPVPKPGPDEVLLRVDAVGICFSDIKLINQGSNHLRIAGRDLAQNPVTPGHEPALTVIEAGENYKDIYKPGDRMMIQPDIYYKGVNISFGYAMDGAMQQFVIVGDPVLKGDEGCYLFPLKPETGYAEAALVEPWTCVVAAYRIKPRRHLKPGGTTLIVEVEEGNWVIDGGACSGGAPGKIILAGASEGLKSRICGCGGCSAEVIEVGKLQPEHIKALTQERTGDKGFDDVIILGTPTPDLVEALSTNLARRAVMAILADKPMARPVSIDVGRVHYDYIDYIGTNTGKVSDAYGKSRDSALLPGGAAWFLGAAGPMGQMHVQRAAKMSDGPRKILCTDVDSARLNYLKSGVEQVAKENGVEIVFVNPVEAGQEAFDQAISDLTGGRGFDDIVVLTPLPVLVEGAHKHLADGGLMNIFAGIPRGIGATLDLSASYMRGSRFTGSSGSRPQDMLDTLHFTETGELPTRSSMAAVGGIDAMADGVKAVQAAKFPGKTVIFPHIQMPLTALTELDKVAPNVYAKLRDGKFWTQEAEDELLRSSLRLG
ncbi:MAG: zinc-binding dehydrogenase [Armatimonadota bacterium]|nr:zinc-binding dehydrogenase [bacterium]